MKKNEFFQCLGVTPKCWLTPKSSFLLTDLDFKISQEQPAFGCEPVHDEKSLFQIFEHAFAGRNTQHSFSKHFYFLFYKNVFFLFSIRKCIFLLWPFLHVTDITITGCLCILTKQIKWGSKYWTAKIRKNLFSFNILLEEQA